MLKVLLRPLREYKKDSCRAPLFVVLEVILEVLIPFFMASLIDIGMEGGNINYVYKMGIVLAVAAVFSLIFGALSGKYAARASAGFAKNLRHDLFYKIQNFSFKNIDRFSTASLVTRLTTDISNVQNAYQMVIRILVRGPLMLIFSLLMAVKISPKLSIIFLVAIPVLAVGLFLIVIKAHPYFSRVFIRYDKLNSVVQENVTAVRVVKAYVREEKENNKFHEISSDVYHEFKKAEKIIAFNSPLMQFAMYTSILLLSFVAAKLIVANTITTGQLTSMIVYATQILSSLMMISMVFVMVIMAQTSAERIVEVLEEKIDLENPEKPISHIESGAIDFDNVDFSYVDDNKKLVLRGIDLHIKSGETIGIIGGTGSAKTSFVQLIPRLYDATNGCVRVGGVDVRKYDMEKLRGDCAMVLQNNVLFSGTIAENLRWGNATATDKELEDACKLAQAHDFISEFAEGYSTMLDQGGTNVSGGQKQRICIARALLKRPKILILDDSTSAVDTKTDAKIREAFRQSLPNTTKIIIAQRISSIADADRVVVLDGGAIDAVGTPEELMRTNKIYREVYKSQGGVQDEA